MEKERQRWNGRTALAALCCAAALLLLEGCYASPRRSEPIKPPLDISSTTRGGEGKAQRIARGQKVFMQQCQQCHPGGEAGLGPALNNKWLPHFLMRFQVRNGWGAMPGFSDEDITGEDLDALMEYLSALKDNG